MTTTRKVIFTRTCDLCGTEQPGDNLGRFGLVPITESDPATSGRASTGPEETRIEESRVDVRSACRERPITELLGALEGHAGRWLFTSIRRIDAYSEALPRSPVTRYLWSVMMRLFGKCPVYALYDSF
jgi:hypothetical protein